LFKPAVNVSARLAAIDDLIPKEKRMSGKVPGIATCLLLVGIGANGASAPPLDWITGHWCADFGEEVVEEYWLPPHGGVAVGLSRTRTAQETTAFEFLRIADIEGVQSYIAQPGGRPPTVFKRTAGGESWIRFENPDHDFPQRIEYRREGDALEAQIAGPGEEGQDLVITFPYVPCGP
jgi:hypothetical protein